MSAATAEDEDELKQQRSHTTHYDETHHDMSRSESPFRTNNLNRRKAKSWLAAGVAGDGVACIRIGRPCKGLARSTAARLEGRDGFPVRGVVRGLEVARAATHDRLLRRALFTLG